MDCKKCKEKCNRKTVGEFLSEKIPKYEEITTSNLRVGISKWILYLIALIILIVIFSIPKWHHRRQPVEGTSIAKVYGTLVSTDGKLTMDPLEYTMNQNVPDSFFIAMKLDVTEQQKCPVKWCTKPGTTNKQHNLTGVEDLTVLIKNWVVLKTRHKPLRRSNFDAFKDKSRLKNCTFDPKDEEDRYCPIFRIGTILDLAGQSASDMDKGGVIDIQFKWVCNARESKIKNCKPEILFKRIDNIKVTEEGDGVNFRNAYYYAGSTRELLKATGVRFIISTTGYGYSFDFTVFAVKVVGMMGVMTLIGIAFELLIVCYKKCQEEGSEASLEKATQTSPEKASEASPEKDSEASPEMDSEACLEMDGASSEQHIV